MSINQAIGNAMSGLAAQSRAAELVSRNVANATTEGYAAKSLSVAQRLNGDVATGVGVAGVKRAEAPILTTSRRGAEAEAEASGANAETSRALADLIGENGPWGSLTERFGAMEDALRALTETPDSAVTRRTAFEAAVDLADAFNAASASTQRLVGEQNDEIARQVETVNQALEKIARLNREISSAQAVGRDATSLVDERERQIDVVNGIVPIRASPQKNGEVEIRSVHGAFLAGFQSRSLKFQPGSAPELIVAGAGSAAETAPTPGGSSLLKGGALEAAFLARDRTIPDFSGKLDESGKLDALAQVVIDRFDAIDLGGSTHLFTEEGDGIGAAGRIRIGLASADELQREADDAGRSADATLPLALYEAFRGAGAGDADLSSLAADLVAESERAAAYAEAEATSRRGAYESVREAELAAVSVDTDAELQNLLSIERAYAANARVLQTADEMMRRILEI